MADIITFKGHDFIKRADGLYETKDTFLLDTINEWYYFEGSYHKVMLCKKEGERLAPWLISDDYPDHTAYFAAAMQVSPKDYASLPGCSHDPDFIGGVGL